MSRPIVVAPAVADDVAQLARLHFAAFPDEEASWLGPRYAQAFVRWFGTQPQAIVLVATAGAAVGYVFGVPPADLRRLYRALLPVAVGCTLMRPWVFAHPELRAMAVRRARLLLGGARDTAPGSGAHLVLKTIAVADGWRRRGVGTRLLEAFTDDARRRGARTLTLNVLARNRSARALYERHGWRPTGQREGEFLEYRIEL